MENAIGVKPKQAQALVRAAAWLAALVMALGLLVAAPSVAHAAAVEYQIYPTPHSVSYGEGSVALGKADLVIESGIDAETQARLDETLLLQAIPGVTWKGDAALPAGDGLSVLVGIKGSGGAVDKHVAQLVQDGQLSYDSQLFTKIDSYLLTVVPAAAGERDEIIVLGKDTDAAFYGLTSLYRIFQQASGEQVREVQLEDYADVRNRGFIEGYYGVPWSTQSRINLMTWGGYHKLNSYFYAPKDDPKHNAQWRELYTEEEITTKIEPLAKAGNDSKTRFIYALHPFMSNRIRVDDEVDNYDESLKKLQAKFQQVIDAGVRQIAILADDAGDAGEDVYVRLLEDMTDWIHGLQAQKNADGTPKYPGLKDTIVFCPRAYMGYGEAWYAQLPATIQVMNTGGDIWGAARHEFFEQFKNNSGGRGTFMWMNFPCSDNNKNALHMANYENFLKLDVQPGDLEGLVMNPMQQSEASKVNLFLGADFEWNLWEGSYEHADQAWKDSFSYVDHNSHEATPASNALRDLSQHLRRMVGAGNVWEGRESATQKDELLAFQAAAKAGTVSQEQVTAVRAIYDALEQPVATYRESGDPYMEAQIRPWLNAFDDLRKTADLFLDAYQAKLDERTDDMVANYQAGTAMLNTYKEANIFPWMPYPGDKRPVAQVGMAYLTPTLDVMAASLKQQVQLAMDPNALIFSYITSRTDTPVGDVASVLDGNDGTGVTYKSPNSITTGTYVGVLANRAFDLDAVKFVLGDASGKNYMDHGQLQVTTDGEHWTPVEGAAEATTSPVTYSGLSVSGVKGVRLYATQDNSLDAWLEVKEIAVNPVPQPAYSLENMSIYSGNYANLTDSNLDGNPLWIRPNGSDSTPAGAAVVLTYPTPQEITKVVYAQPAGGDEITDGVLEYTSDGSSWKQLAQIGSGNNTVDVNPAVSALAVRVRNKAATGKWWKINEFQVITKAQQAVDKSALKGNIAQAQGKKEADYTVFTWQVLSGALAQALEVAGRATASQEEVDQASELLANAIAGLRPSTGGETTGGNVPVDPDKLESVVLPTDFSKLRTMLQVKESLVPAEYTVDSWAAVTAAQAKAEAVLADTKASQAEVDAALAALNDAVKALEPKSEPDTPGDKEEPVTPEQPSDPEQPSEVDTPAAPQVSKLAQTGLEIGSPALVAFLLIVGGSLAVHRKMRES